MATEIITTDDLREFKIELLEEIRQLFKDASKSLRLGQPWPSGY